jgi:hypothetical protein
MRVLHGDLVLAKEAFAETLGVVSISNETLYGLARSFIG